MGVCTTIAKLASEIETQLVDLTENQRGMIAVMKEMPSYLEKGDLAAWDSDYKATISDNENESSANFMAIDLIYEIAAINLYGAFESKKTKKWYKQAVKELRKLGVDITKGLDVSQW